MNLNLLTSSRQPATFAEPSCLYATGVGRCAWCESTIRLNRDGEWVHPSVGGMPPTVWCRNGG